MALIRLRSGSEPGRLLPRFSISLEPYTALPQRIDIGAARRAAIGRCDDLPKAYLRQATSRGQVIQPRPEPIKFVNVLVPVGMPTGEPVTTLHQSGPHRVSFHSAVRTRNWITKHIYEAYHLLRDGMRGTMSRKPLGDRAMTAAERQARYRVTRAEGAPRIRYRRPADRRARPQRWRDAVAELVTLQAEYQQWLDTLPETSWESATGRALRAICYDLDLSELASIKPPRGFGRDG
jgi:hypothetical protein